MALQEGHKFRGVCPVCWPNGAGACRFRFDVAGKDAKGCHSCAHFSIGDRGVRCNATSPPYGYNMTSTARPEACSGIDGGEFKLWSIDLRGLRGLKIL